jgi:hypothetical protein
VAVSGQAGAAAAGGAQSPAQPQLSANWWQGRLNFNSLLLKGPSPSLRLGVRERRCQVPVSLSGNFAQAGSAT